jgi:hypothetical protein
MCHRLRSSLIYNQYYSRMIRSGTRMPLFMNSICERFTIVTPMALVILRASLKTRLFAGFRNHGHLAASVLFFSPMG